MKSSAKATVGAEILKINATSSETCGLFRDMIKTLRKKKLQDTIGKSTESDFLNSSPNR
ncbi:rRNA adenine N(6)-methyltransferase [Psidium guajava]|nr:rRNA adenine N(6)-methyltransferase [Psidium guajava]